MMMVFLSILNAGEACRSTAVMIRGRLWQAGQGMGVAVDAAFAVLECAIRTW